MPQIEEQVEAEDLVFLARNETVLPYLQRHVSKPEVLELIGSWGVYHTQFSQVLNDEEFSMGILFDPRKPEILYLVAHYGKSTGLEPAQLVMYCNTYHQINRADRPIAASPEMVLQTHSHLFSLYEKYITQIKNMDKLCKVVSNAEWGWALAEKDRLIQMFMDYATLNEVRSNLTRGMRRFRDRVVVRLRGKKLLYREIGEVLGVTPSQIRTYYERDGRFNRREQMYNENHETQTEGGNIWAPRWPQ